MTRTFQAELVRLLRRRVIVPTVLIALAFAVGGAAIVLAAAKPAAHAAPGTPTIEALSQAGGGSQVFRLASSFAGTFLFVVFCGVTAAEFSRGTMRTMLLRQPRRVPLLAGRLGAMLAFAAAVLAGTEVVMWLAARVFAPGQGVTTGTWMTIAGVRAGLGDYGAVLLWITGYAVLGTTVGVLLRSVPLALGVGIAWAGPFEHLVRNAWSPATRLFPGLLLEAFVAGGTPDVTAGRALLTVSLYVVLAAAAASAVFSRWDVTS